MTGDEKMLCLFCHRNEVHVFPSPGGLEYTAHMLCCAANGIVSLGSLPVFAHEGLGVKCAKNIQKRSKTLKMPHSARILTRFPQPACKLPFIFCVKESVRNFQQCSALKSCKHVEVFGDMCAFRG